MTAKRLAKDVVRQSVTEEEEINTVVKRLTANVLGESFREEGINTMAKMISEKVLQQSVREEIEVFTTAEHISDDDFREESEIEMKAKRLANEILVRVVHHDDDFDELLHAKVNHIPAEEDNSKNDPIAQNPDNVELNRHEEPSQQIQDNQKYDQQHHCRNQDPQGEIAQVIHFDLAMFN